METVSSTQQTRAEFFWEIPTAHRKQTLTVTMRGSGETSYTNRCCRENILRDLSSHLPAYSSHKHPSFIKDLHEICQFTKRFLLTHKSLQSGEWLKFTLLNILEEFEYWFSTENCGTDESLESHTLHALYLILHDYEAMYLCWTAKSAVEKEQEEWTVWLFIHFHSQTVSQINVVTKCK